LVWLETGYIRGRYDGYVERDLTVTDGPWKGWRHFPPPLRHTISSPKSRERAALAPFMQAWQAQSKALEYLGDTPLQETRMTASRATCTAGASAGGALQQPLSDLKGCAQFLGPLPGKLEALSLGLPAFSRQCSRPTRRRAWRGQPPEIRSQMKSSLIRKSETQAGSSA
jgi:hypothetical protein